MPSPVQLLFQPCSCSISECFCTERGQVADLLNPGYFLICLQSFLALCGTAGHKTFTVSPNGCSALGTTVAWCKEMGFALALLYGKDLGNHDGPALSWGPVA